MRKKIFAVGNSYYLAISLLLFYVEHFSACINAKQSDGNFHFFDSKKKRAYQRACTVFFLIKRTQNASGSCLLTRA